MMRTIRAVFENGVLRPLEPLQLSENELVTVTIADETQANDDADFHPGPETDSLTDEEFERLLDELAAGPALPPLPADFSRADIYADHD